MKLAAFDLEIAALLPEGETDWKEHRPLGISCAAVKAGDLLIGWDGRYADGGRLPAKSCQQIVYSLMQLADLGWKIVTWNGLAFDFDVLAEESGLLSECAQLAISHVDLMFLVVSHRGHFLGLDTAAKGMGIEGKLHDVRLSTGELLDDMHGAKAPELWAKGEYSAVMDYLAEDVRSTLELAEACLEQGVLRWTARSGRPNVINNFELLSVFDALKLPERDTSWMTDPPSRSAMMAWTRGE